MTTLWKAQDCLVNNTSVVGGDASITSLLQEQLNRLQCIQNIAARVVTLSKKSCHIAPVLKDLHWLPVRYRMTYCI